MKKMLVFLFIAILFVPINSSSSEKLPGKYELIGDINKAFGKNQVTMVEFFNFSCGHCYRFLTTSKPLLAKFGKKLVHKKIPIYWGKQTPYPAIAFYLAEKDGKTEEIVQSIFDANFLGGAQIFDPRVVNFIISDSGITKDVRKQDDMQQKVFGGLNLAKQLAVNATPTIILNDVIKITPKITDGNVDKMTENLDLIISKLLSK